MQPGDAAKVWVGVEDLFAYVNYRPKMDIEEGISKLLNWYRKYYQIKLSEYGV